MAGRLALGGAALILATALSGPVWAQAPAPDGTKTVVVPHVHTHELFLDAAGNLYGESLRYEGDATKRWQHYFWNRSPAGTITRIVAEHEPFHNEDAHFTLVRDAAGNNYWANAETKAVMRNGEVLARGPFRDPRWMTVTPDGTLYFIAYEAQRRGDRDALYRSDGTEAGTTKVPIDFGGAVSLSNLAAVSGSLYLTATASGEYGPLLFNFS